MAPDAASERHMTAGSVPLMGANVGRSTLLLTLIWARSVKQECRVVLERHDDWTGAGSRATLEVPAKRRRALLGSNPPRNSRSGTHGDPVGAGGYGSPAPLRSLGNRLQVRSSHGHHRRFPHAFKNPFIEPRAAGGVERVALGPGRCVVCPSEPTASPYMRSERHGARYPNSSCTREVWPRDDGTHLRDRHCDQSIG